MQSRNLHLKTFILIFFMVIFGPLGDVFLAQRYEARGRDSKMESAAVCGVFLARVHLRYGLAWNWIASAVFCELYSRAFLGGL